MDQNFDHFIAKHVDCSKSLAIAVSGGADSICLLEMFLRYEKESNLDLHVLHVNHNYRHESGIEADKLREMVLARGISFHLHTIPKSSHPKTNLEMFFRKQRYDFFRQKCNQLQIDQVFLAHHKDDIIETFVKRILECKSLRSLKTMTPKITMHGIDYFRPLYNMNKKAIIEFLEINKIEWFEDSSNLDLVFTRNRIRHDILPYMQNAFGKNISDNLFSLAMQCNDFSQYVSQMARPYIDSHCDLGIVQSWDYPTNEDIFLQKQILGCILAKELQGIPFHITSQLFDQYIENRNAVSVSYQNILISIQQNKIWIAQKFSSSSQVISLEEGAYQWGQWQVRIKKENLAGPINTSILQQSRLPWQFYVCNEENITIRLPKPKEEWFFKGKKYNLSDWYRENRIPLPIRRVFPMIFQDNTLLSDPLTGSCILKGSVYFLIEGEFIGNLDRF